MSEYNHPFDPGTVLEGESSDLLKFILSVEPTESGGQYRYTVWSTGVASEQPRTQTSMDFEHMAEDNDYPDWTVVYEP